jgi:hypothetical protein
MFSIPSWFSMSMMRRTSPLGSRGQVSARPAYSAIEIVTFLIGISVLPRHSGTVVHRNPTMALLAERILRSPSAVLVAGGERAFRSRLLNELAGDPRNSPRNGRRHRRSWPSVSRTSGRGDAPPADPRRLGGRARRTALHSRRGAVPASSSSRLSARARRLLRRRRPRGGPATDARHERVRASDGIRRDLRHHDGPLARRPGRASTRARRARGIDVLEMDEEKGPALDRATARTHLWNEFLERASEVALPLEGLPFWGTSSPTASNAFPGRQIAFLGAHARLLASGKSFHSRTEFFEPACIPWLPGSRALFSCAMRGAIPAGSSRRIRQSSRGPALPVARTRALPI